MTEQTSQKVSERDDTATELPKREHGEKSLREGGQHIRELGDERRHVTGAPREKGERKRKCLKQNNQNFPNCDENYKPRDPRILLNEPQAKKKK